jgi:hypothetical protein
MLLGNAAAVKMAEMLLCTRRSNFCGREMSVYPEFAFQYRAAPGGSGSKTTFSAGKWGQIT